MILYPVAQLSRTYERSKTIPEAAGPLNPGSIPSAAAGSQGRTLLVLGQLLELVRGEVRIDPPGRNLRDPVRPHLHLVPAAGEFDHDPMEDVVLLVAQQP